MPTAMDNQEQLTLRTNRELGYQLDLIITKIQRLAEKFSIETQDKKSPFKNVLTVATEATTSLEVLKNYIRYQVGRKGASKIWTNNKGAFAIAVVEEIKNLSEDTKQIVDRVIQQLPESEPLLTYIRTNRPEIERLLHLRLAQLYLGYLSREHAARVGSKGSQDNASDEQENHV